MKLTALEGPNRNSLVVTAVVATVVVVTMVDATAVVFIFVLLGKNIGRQIATRIHEQEA